MERGECAIRKSDVPAECAYRKVLEVAAALAPLGIKSGDRLRFQFSLWQNDLPVDAVPQEGWIELDLDPAWWG
jgi:hypothetical protein